MKSFKANVTIILMVLFEIVVGILLFVDPEEFTRTVLIIFGAILLVIGIVNLIKFLIAKKKEENDAWSLLVGLVSLILGVIGAFFSKAIIDLITAIAVVYGIILVISGIYKMQNFSQAKKAKVSISKVSFGSGLLAIVLGVLVVLYPKDAAFSVWQLTGIILIVEAIIDFVSILQGVKIKKESK